MKFFTQCKDSIWFAPLCLMFLSFVPVIAGLVRILQLSTGTLSSQYSRFSDFPIPIVVHILASTLFGFLGAFQFSKGLRTQNPNWHRKTGKVLLVAGLLSATTGLWMTAFYQVPKVDENGVYILRMITGALMTLFIFFGINSIRIRNFNQHGEWMIRSYAIALGAGTQVFTHIPWALFPSIQSETSRTLFMGLGWLINMFIAEWIIQKSKVKIKNNPHKGEVNESNYFKTAIGSDHN